MTTTDPSRDLQEVAPGVLVFHSELWQSNTTVIVESDDAFLIDPGVTPEDLAALGAALGRRNLTLVGATSTHPHWDHILWSAELAALEAPDCPRFAAPRAIDLLSDDLTRAWQEAEATAPGHDLELFGALDPLGTADSAPAGSIVPMLAPAPVGVRALVHDAHAWGSLALLTRGVLIAGDLLSDVEIPLLNLGPGDDWSRAPWDPVGDYRWTLDCLWSAVEDFNIKVLVPGHGSVAFGQEAILDRIARDRAYLRALELSAKPVARPFAKGCGNLRCWCYSAHVENTQQTLTVDATSAAAVQARASVIDSRRNTSEALGDPRLTDPRLADSENIVAHARQTEYLAVHRRR